MAVTLRLTPKRILSCVVLVAIALAAVFVPLAFTVWSSSAADPGPPPTSAPTAAPSTTPAPTSRPTSRPTAQPTVAPPTHAPTTTTAAPTTAAPTTSPTTAAPTSGASSSNVSEASSSILSTEGIVGMAVGAVITVLIVLLVLGYRWRRRRARRDMQWNVDPRGVGGSSSVVGEPSLAEDGASQSLLVHSQRSEASGIRPTIPHPPPLPAGAHERNLIPVGRLPPLPPLPPPPPPPAIQPPVPPPRRPKSSEPLSRPPQVEDEKSDASSGGDGGGGGGDAGARSHRERSRSISRSRLGDEEEDVLNRRVLHGDFDEESDYGDDPDAALEADLYGNAISPQSYPGHAGAGGGGGGKGRRKARDAGRVRRAASPLGPERGSFLAMQLQRDDTLRTSHATDPVTPKQRSVLDDAKTPRDGEPSVYGGGGGGGAPSSPRSVASSVEPGAARALQSFSLPLPAPPPPPRRVRPPPPPPPPPPPSTPPRIPDRPPRLSRLVKAQRAYESLPLLQVQDAGHGPERKHAYGAEKKTKRRVLFRTLPLPHGRGGGDDDNDDTITRRLIGVAARTPAVHSSVRRWMQQKHSRGSGGSQTHGRVRHPKSTTVDGRSAVAAAAAVEGGDADAVASDSDERDEALQRDLDEAANIAMGVEEGQVEETTTSTPAAAPADADAPVERGDTTWVEPPHMSPERGVRRLPDITLDIADATRSPEAAAAIATPKAEVAHAPDQSGILSLPASVASGVPVLQPPLVVAVGAEPPEMKYVETDERGDQLIQPTPKEKEEP